MEIAESTERQTMKFPEFPIIGPINRIIKARADMIEARTRNAHQVESMTDCFRRAEERFVLGLGEIERELEEMDRKEYLVQAIRVSVEDPFVANGLRNWVNYVVGTGSIVQSENQAALDQWKEWKKRNKFGAREKEICRRGARDGDAFIRYFGVGPEMTIRFIDSEAVSEPISPPSADNWSQGIGTLPDDVEAVIGYWVLRDANDSNSGFLVPATGNEEAVTHYAFREESTAKFGTALLRPVLRTAKQLDIEIDYQHALMQMRLALGITEKIHAAPSGIASGGLGGDSSDSRTSNTQFVKAMKPGSIATHNAGVELQFMSPNLDAGDVVAFYAYRGRRIAAGFGQPEYMVTADASNNNRAGSIVAGSPFFKAVSSERADGIGPIIWQVYVRVTGDVDATVEWPRLDSGNRAEDAKALYPAVVGGTLDGKTYLEEIDIDPEMVGERLEAEEDARGADDEDFRIARDRDGADEGGESESVRESLDPMGWTGHSEEFLRLNRAMNESIEKMSKGEGEEGD